MMPPYADRLSGPPVRVFFFLATVALTTIALGQPPSPSPDAPDINVRYARAALRAAELDLRQASGVNERFPGTIGAVTLQHLRNQVVVATARLKAAKDGGRRGFQDVLLAEAEANLKIAELKLQNAAARRSPASLRTDNPDRLRPEADMNHMAIERIKSSQASEMQQLQWQIEALRQHVCRQQIHIDELETLVKQ
jgi:Tfp pilus assembly protein PilX